MFRDISSPPLPPHMHTSIIALDMMGMMKISCLLCMPPYSAMHSDPHIHGRADTETVRWRDDNWHYFPPPLPLHIDKLQCKLMRLQYELPKVTLPPRHLVTKLYTWFTNRARLTCKIICAKHGKRSVYLFTMLFHASTQCANLWVLFHICNPWLFLTWMKEKL